MNAGIRIYTRLCKLSMVVLQELKTHRDRRFHRTGLIQTTDHD